MSRAKPESGAGLSPRRRGQPERVTHRLFVAVYPPPDALDSLNETVAGLHLGKAAAAGVNTRLAPRSRWHLTLAFMGAVEERRLSDVDDAAGQAALRAVAPTVRLAGGGRFGRGRFTVLWIGVRGEVDPLTDLARDVRRRLRRARVPYDEKPFRPHLTLARPGDRLGAADLAADLAVLSGYEGPLWRVEELRLIRSHLGPDPAHEQLAAYPLAADR